MQGSVPTFKRLKNTKCNKGQKSIWETLLKYMLPLDSFPLKSATKVLTSRNMSTYYKKKMHFWTDHKICVSDDIESQNL